MSIPTSGSYSGLDISKGTSISSLGGAVPGDLANLENLLDSVGLGSVVTQYATDLTAYTPVATNATVAFNGTTLTAGGATFSDAGTVASNPNAFEFAQNGTNYVVSNGPLTTNTVDDEVATLIGDAGQVPVFGGQIQGDLRTLGAAIDADGYGGALAISPGFFTDTTNGNAYNAPCFVRGTRIATTRGDVPVETLAPGDQVRLARGGTAPVTWIGHRRVDLETCTEPGQLRPVVIGTGALGNALPRRDLRLSQDHALYLQGVLVPAGLLANGETIRIEGEGRVEYFHVELAAHDIILAEGAAAETYLDTGNRTNFANTAIVALRPSLAAGGGEPCAPMALDGPTLQSVRAHLARVAAAPQRKAS